MQGTEAPTFLIKKINFNKRVVSDVTLEITHSLKSIFFNIK